MIIIVQSTNELIYITNTINECGQKLETYLKNKGYEVEFGKKSEGKQDLSDLIDMVINIGE